MYPKFSNGELNFKIQSILRTIQSHLWHDCNLQ